MSLDILHIIKRILLSDQTVSVPGLGVFYLQRIPAQVDKIRNEFYPPSTEIQFKLKPETRGDRLIQALIDELGLDKQASLQSISTYVGNIRDRIEANERVELSGLGHLYTDTNDNLIFDGKESDLIFVATAYPTYTLDPVVRKSEPDIITSQKALGIKKNIAKEKKRSTVGLEQIVPFLLLCLAVSVVFGLYTWNKNRTGAPTVELMSIDENRLNKKPNTDSQAIETRDIILNEDTPIDYSINDSSNELTEMTDAYHPEELNDEDMNDEEGNQPMIERMEDVLKAEEELNKSNSISSDCIIVVGAFGSTANVNKMIRRIEALGWSRYKNQEPGGLTRVGVQVDCNSAQQALRQVKNKIEPSAWILE